MLTNILPLFVLLPILGFIGCVLVPKNRERLIFSIAFATVLLGLGLFLLFGYEWLNSGARPVFAHLGNLYESHHYTFSVDFYFDRLAAVFLGVTIVMANLIFLFSKYYMHREPGFKRFYYTVLLFFIGLMLIVLAGNFEVLLVGWEFIGISSVLLIAFYRDRYLPARNALKVFSVYRIADAFLLAAIWHAHHLFEKNINFSEFSHLVSEHGNQLTVLGLLLLVTALIKSAQFPFSYWLPRAMEGPTSSSAIFYGALSVHMGLFLLLRTYPLWEGSVGTRIAIAVLGLVTAVVASSIARVQSSVKVQIAYSSVTQIAIMFIEVAAGLHWLALLHFVSNASLRTYQLLISPAIVGYLVHDQFFTFVPYPTKIKNTFVGRLRATLYTLGIKEWDMNARATQYIWMPLKTVGRWFKFLDTSLAQVAAVVMFVLAAVYLTSDVSVGSALIASVAMSVAGSIFYIRAYSTKGSARRCWNLIMLGHLFGALFLGFASEGDLRYLLTYGAGVALAFVAGHICLWYLRLKGEPLTLASYNGSIIMFRVLGHVFFFVCLFFMAFPISPSFIGQEVLLSLIPGGHVAQVVLYCLAYLLAGVSMMRLYTKVFFGPHKAKNREMAYKSS